jgi:hypothetical protein
MKSLILCEINSLLLKNKLIKTKSMNYFRFSGKFQKFSTNFCSKQLTLSTKAEIPAIEVIL